MGTFNDIRARFESALIKRYQEINENQNRGYEFEQNIIEGINSLNNPSILIDGGAAGNDNSISDLGLLVDNKPIAAEVKLADTDNLGALPKADVESIIFDGNKVSYKIKRTSQYYEILDEALSAMNSNKVIPILKNIYDAIKDYLKGPLDLTKVVGSLRGDKNDRAIFQAISNTKKQFTGSNDVKVKPETIRKLISKKKGPNGAPTDYIIIGNNNHKKIEGQVYHLGNNPLNINVPEFNPSGVFVEMRLQGSGSTTKGTAAYGFGMKTKNSGKINPGRKFSSSTELANIFLGK